MSEVQAEAIIPAADPDAAVAFVSVVYDEFKPDTYEGVSLHLRCGSGEPKEMNFTTGNFLHDYASAMHAAWSNAGRTSVSSSVDGFVADVMSAR